MRNLIGPLFLLVSCLLFSVTGTLQQLAPEGHTPVVITEVRMFLGALTIFLWCLWTHRLPPNWSAVPWKPMLIASGSRSCGWFSGGDCDNSFMGGSGCIFTF